MKLRLTIFYHKPKWCCWKVSDAGGLLVPNEAHWDFSPSAAFALCPLSSGWLEHLSKQESTNRSHRLALKLHLHWAEGGCWQAPPRTCWQTLFTDLFTANSPNRPLPKIIWQANQGKRKTQNTEESAFLITSKKHLSFKINVWLCTFCDTRD